MRENFISERRLTNRLIRYWERLKGDKDYADIRKFNGNSVEDIWGFCFTVSLQSGASSKRMFRYEYVGREVQKAYGSNPTGEFVSSSMVRLVPGAEIMKKLDACIEEESPIVEQGRFINKKDRIIKYRSCIIPFGQTGREGVTHILIGLSWKEF